MSAKSRGFIPNILITSFVVLFILSFSTIFILFTYSVSLSSQEQELDAFTGLPLATQSPDFPSYMRKSMEVELEKQQNRTVKFNSVFGEGSFERINSSIKYGLGRFEAEINHQNEESDLVYSEPYNNVDENFVEETDSPSVTEELPTNDSINSDSENHNNFTLENVQLPPEIIEDENISVINPPNPPSDNLEVVEEELPSEEVIYNVGDPLPIENPISQQPDSPETGNETKNELENDNGLGEEESSEPVIQSPQEPEVIDETPVPSKQTVSEEFDCQGEVFTVVNTNDTGLGSLRDAIIQSNQDVDCNPILFNIPNETQILIQLNTILPTIIYPVVIDGKSQDGFDEENGVPVIQVDGSFAVSDTVECGRSGLCFDGTGLTIKSVVRNISITGFETSGIAFMAEAPQNTSGLILRGNYIGIAPDLSNGGNGGAGVALGNSSGHIIGGGDGDKNIIVNNGGDGIYMFGVRQTVVVGNYIGVSPDGNVELGNEESGIYLDSTSNIAIGGANDGSGNVISGNGTGIEDGITVIADSSNIEILRNIIGLNPAGNKAMPNTYAGVYIAFRDNFNIKVGECGNGNFISGNGLIDTQQQYGLFTFADRVTAKGNVFGYNLTKTEVIPGQNKDLVIIGNSGEFGGDGNCANEFKPGELNFENLGFGNVFFKNIGTNNPPNGTMEYFFENDRSVEPVNLIINVNASDLDGGINRVELISRGLVVETKNTQPFTFSLNNLKTGEYPIYARIVDNEGQSNRTIIQTAIVNEPQFTYSPWLQNGNGVGENQLISFDNKVIQSIRGTDNGVYTRISFDGLNWNQWEWSGAMTLSPVSMIVFKGRVYQSIQGIDTGIYTRSSSNGVNWTPWQFSGGTLDRVSMAVNGELLYQAIRGTDSNIYTRTTFDGINWTPWTPSGGTNEWVSMGSLQGRLFQTIRGTDSGIYTRSTIDGINWTPWVHSGSTLTTPRLVVLQNKIFLAIKGTDNNLYTSTLSSDLVQTSWVPLDGIINTPRFGSIGKDVYIAYQQPNGVLCTRSMSEEGIIWSFCENGGDSIGLSTFGVYGSRLFQARVNNNGVLSYRSVSEGSSWTEWANEPVNAQGGIGFVEFNGRFIQSFYGNDGGVFIRSGTISS